MNNISTLIGAIVDVKISGEAIFRGTLIEIGQDIIVLFDDKNFIYIPLLHIHRINLSDDLDETISDPNETSLEKIEAISFRETLLNAKGIFTEIYVTGGKSLHGYITEVRSDYVVFYSPIYKTIFISLTHLKWLTPYKQNMTPYTLSNKEFPANPFSNPLLNFFEEQLKKFEGKLVVLDIQATSMKV
ncbi:DUF2642 domain-containing protein [Priestia aryabhattai]|uniref:DUF2642 domain-containing protein n=1 Tax=Priestia aryabhattai TaxID=412384 RepID=UPI0039A3A5FB